MAVLRADLGAVRHLPGRVHHARRGTAPPNGFFWVAIAPLWFVTFFLPEIPLRRGQITRRQRVTLGEAVPVLLFAAAVLGQTLLRWAVTR